MELITGFCGRMFVVNGQVRMNGQFWMDGRLSGWPVCPQAERIFLSLYLLLMYLNILTFLNNS